MSSQSIAEQLVDEVFATSAKQAKKMDAGNVDLAQLAIIAAVEQELVRRHRELGRTIHESGRTWIEISYAVGLKAGASAETRYSGMASERGRQRRARLAAEASGQAKGAAPAKRKRTGLDERPSWAAPAPQPLPVPGKDN